MQDGGLSATPKLDCATLIDFIVDLDSPSFNFNETPIHGASSAASDT